MADKTAEALEKEIKRLSKEIQDNKELLSQANGLSKQILEGVIGGTQKKLDTAVKSLESIDKDNKVVIQEQKKTEQRAKEMSIAQESTKLSVDSLKKMLKAGRDKTIKLETEKVIASQVESQKLQAKIDEQLEQNRKIEELLTTAQKQDFGKVMTKISERIGQEIAQKREIQGNFTAYLAENRNLLQAIKKDTKGEALQAMIREMALALQKDDTYKDESLEALEALVEKNIDVEKAVTSASDVFYGVKKSLSDMKDGILDTLEKSKIGGLFTAEMREHWKSGFDQIKGVVAHHMSEIMKPIEILLGPIKAFIKVGMILYKMLKNRKPTPIESRTAHWQDATKSLFVEMNKTLHKTFMSDKKRLDLLEDIEKKKDREVEKKKSSLLVGIGALLAGVVAGFVGQVHAAFKGIINPLMWLGSSLDKGVMKIAEFLSKSKIKIVSFFGDTFKWIRGLFTKVGNFFSKIGKWFTGGPLGKFMFRLGKVFGKAIQPLMIAWNLFKDFGKMVEMWKTEGGFAKVAGQIGANIMDVILQIPEWVINGILKLMGSEFSVDFGKEAILKMISDMTSGLSDMIWNWFGTDGTQKTGSFGADFDPDSYPEVSKAVDDRTANRNVAVVQQALTEKKKADNEKAAAVELKQSIDTLNTTTHEGSTMVAGSIQINTNNNVPLNIPEVSEENSMAFMGDMLGGFP